MGYIKNVKQSLKSHFKKAIKCNILRQIANLKEWCKLKLEFKRSENFVSLFFRLKIPFFARIFRAYFQFYRAPTAWVHGYSARTEQGKSVLFMDYDNLDLKSVLQELRFLQQKHSLSDFYVFELDRTDSFHAVCLDTMPLSEVHKILTASSCDAAFINSVRLLRSREWVLRFDKKANRAAPSFICKVRAKGCRIKSSAHALFLKQLNAPVSVSGKWDHCKELTLIDYNTANRIDENAV